MGGSSEERAFVSLEKVRTAHASVRRNFYSDFTAKRFCSNTGNKRRQLSTSLGNAHGTQPATGKFLHGVLVLARAACCAVHQLNLKLPIGAEERVAAGGSGTPGAPRIVTSLKTQEVIYDGIRSIRSEALEHCLKQAEIRRIRGHGISAERTAVVWRIAVHRIVNGRAYRHDIGADFPVEAVPLVVTW